MGVGGGRYLKKFGVGKAACRKKLEGLGAGVRVCGSEDCVTLTSLAITGCL